MFEELTVGVQIMGELAEEAGWLVVLPISLPVEYELTLSIIKDSKGITSIVVRE